MNHYGFASGDPINFSDPFGLKQCGKPGETPCAGGLEGAGLLDPIAWVSGGLGIAIERGVAAMMASRMVANEGPTIVSGLSGRGAANNALRTMGLPVAQEAAARSAISRATTKEMIEFIKQPADNLYVHISRPGRNGFQVMQSVISPNGAKGVTQYGVDAAGRVTADYKKIMPR
jgi:hypothetical protein